MKYLSLLLLIGSTAFGQLNSLTPKEIEDGWILLFDGETSFGWTQEGGAKWHVADGALVADGESGWLRSDSPFADFILSCEFRTSAEGNSGVFVRSAKEGAPHETGYEVQIWDKHPKFPTGSLVNHIRVKKVRKLKPDEWNSFEIEARGDRFIVKLNGDKVLDGQAKKSRIGHIGLQYNKDNKIEFRNIKIKPLDLLEIFNGKTLIGWREVKAPKPPQQPPVWSVKDGAIHVEKGPGQLETIAVYDDFILQLDVRTNPKDSSHHPNSGVFFRGDSMGYWTGYESQIRNEYKDNDRTQPVDWGTGAIYNRIVARKIVANDGEWFTKTIVARGRHLAVWINGYPVTDWEDTRPEGTNAREAAKLTAGPISLQAHDPTTNLDFKRIRIDSLPKARK